MLKISFLEVNDENLINTTALLAEEIWNEYFTPIIGKSQVKYMLYRFQSINAISKQIKDGYHYYLITDDQDYKGYIGIDFKNTYLFLSKIYIKSTYRGMGYGRQAIEFIEKLAKENNLDKISLTVNKNNINSIEAYRKWDFRIVEPIVQDIGNGYIMDDYKMEKSL